MRAGLAASLDGAAKLSATIDGFPVRELHRLREQSPVFSITLPTVSTAIGEGSFSPGPSYPVVDDGVYLLFEPLRPGKHVIHTHGEFPAWNSWRTPSTRSPSRPGSPRVRAAGRPHPPRRPALRARPRVGNPGRGWGAPLEGREGPACPNWDRGPA